MTPGRFRTLRWPKKRLREKRSGRRQSLRRGGLFGMILVRIKYSNFVIVPILLTESSAYKYSTQHQYEPRFNRTSFLYHDLYSCRILCSFLCIKRYKSNPRAAIFVDFCFYNLIFAIEEAKFENHEKTSAFFSIMMLAYEEATDPKKVDMRKEISFHFFYKKHDRNSVN